LFGSWADCVFACFILGLFDSLCHYWLF
jgi:hypothetical protein